MWVFDDEERGLLREPFVGGTDLVIDKLVENIPNAELGFKLIFSGGNFSGATPLRWVGEEDGGNVYEIDKFNMRGWLCPALLKYFQEAPATLYVQAR